MNGRSYNFKNAQINPTNHYKTKYDLSLSIHKILCQMYDIYPSDISMFKEKQIEFLKHNNWKVLDICGHHDGMSLIYLLGCGVYRLGLMIGSEGFDVVHRTNQTVNREYYYA